MGAGAEARKSKGDPYVDAPGAQCDQARRPGRPRDPQADEAIVNAVVDILAEQGFSGFTVEDVAARAGVGKATIYRRWSTREDLILAAAERVIVQVDPPDTGSLRDDLVGWYWEKFRNKAASSSDRLMGQLIIESSVNDDIKKLLAQFIRDRRRSTAEIVDRGRSRGDCGPIDAELLMDLVSGALLHRSLFGDRPLRRSDVKAVVDAALSGVVATSAD